MDGEACDNPTRHGGRRPRQKAEETREEILTTAERLFRQIGIAKTSIADIAETLGMSPANVFKHFHSKTALADAICDRHIRKIISRFRTLDQSAPPPEKLGLMARRIMEAHLADLEENPFLFEMVILMSETDLPSGRHYKELIDSLFADLIREGIASGDYACTDPQRIGQHVAAAFAGVLHPVFLVRENKTDLVERCDGIAKLVIAALQNPLAK